MFIICMHKVYMAKIVQVYIVVTMHMFTGCYMTFMII